MSQSPEDASGDADQEPYLQAFSDLANKIRNGASFSGRERNCSFSNRGDGTFADVSGLTGFDFPEDGRGIALTDWDHDGDVDLWLANRTAPRLQFLQNRIPAADSRWISFRLEGDPSQGVPRDGVGSRVELKLSGGGRRVKTLHAGEGFMSQSTKWLHFGLQEGREVEEVKVFWKGELVESFSGAGIRQRWHLKQGSGKALAAKRRDPVALEENPLIPLPMTGIARIGLSQPLKTPPLPYRDLDGREQSISSLTAQNIVLVNLWNECEQCHEELKMFADSQEQLAKAGIKVVALNVGKLVDGKEPAGLLKAAGFSGYSGTASAELVELLDTSIAKSVYHHRGTPVPTSFLIDRGGWLSVIYKGPVSLATLLKDASTLGRSAEISRAAALPFTGKWAEKSFSSNPVRNAAIYLEGEYFEDARGVLLDFLKDNGSPPAKAGDAQAHGRNMQQAEVYYVLGEADRLEGKVAAALVNYQKSLQYNPRQVVVLNHLAWIFATSADPKIRSGTKAVGYAEFMMGAPKVPENPDLLGTVAAAYASAGNFPNAIAITKKAISLLGDPSQIAALKRHRERLMLYEKSAALTE